MWSNVKTYRVKLSRKEGQEHSVSSVSSVTDATDATETCEYPRVSDNVEEKFFEQAAKTLNQIMTHHNPETTRLEYVEKSSDLKDSEASQDRFRRASSQKSLSAQDRSLRQQLEVCHALEMAAQRQRAKIISEIWQNLVAQCDQLWHQTPQMQKQTPQRQTQTQQHTQIHKALCLARTTQELKTATLRETIAQRLAQQQHLLAQLHNAELRDATNDWYAVHRHSVQKLNREILHTERTLGGTVNGTLGESLGTLGTLAGTVGTLAAPSSTSLSSQRLRKAKGS